MPLIHDLRTLFFGRGKRQPVIDLTITQAGGLERAAHGSSNTETPSDSALLDPSLAGSSFSDDESEQSTIAATDVVAAPARPNDHTPPTLTDVWQRLGELAAQHRSGMASLERMADAASGHAQRLDTLQHQLEINHQLTDNLLRAIDELRTMQVDLLSASRHCSEQLDRVIEVTASADSKTRSTLRRIGIWVIASLLVSAAAGIIAIILAVMALQQQ